MPGMITRGRRASNMANSDSTPGATATSDSQVPGLGLTAEQREDARQLMLERLAATRAHFAHQQRDTPDLTLQEKIDIAAEILSKNPATFLARFERYLHPSDLVYFQDLAKENYEINFHLKEIEHRCSHTAMIVKNRRYAAMKELEAGGDYFSQNEMKRREPLLYEQMVGQFLTNEEQEQQVAAAIDRSDLRFSTILMRYMEDAQERALYKLQKDKEEDQKEEEDDDSEEEDEDGPKQHIQAEMDTYEEEAEDIPEISDTRATDIWRQQLQDEFRAIMHEKFLSGDDFQFDYSKVDDNPDYDSLATMAQDEEYRYFQLEAPLTVDLDTSDSDKGSRNNGVTREAGEDEEDDYMLYEPSPELISKSARFVRIGQWNDGDDP